ncbi:outer membrane efflux protein [Candidatus Scalindua japonica]|uniref:Outer membrane efflux protein n=1 Tax=Candidatus Scalindua japonica TaxID=1284222 RepID=A0A286TWL2_9BACT|nr:TolC family protein [Candidatus Scalindua japonica]GAX60268.1 outer membrane efflux protein [Candidatus Scalindua japonica]
MCLKTLYYFFLFPVVLISVGCFAHLTHDRAYVSDSISRRTGHNLASDEKAEDVRLPDNISLIDGLTEDEAVAIALWNNAKFQSDLTDLGFSRADLIEAGMISNPVFSMFFPAGPKQMETTIFMPIESLWQRPCRVSAARLSAERVAENLVQNGLNLVRDVMLTYTNLIFSQERVNIAKKETVLNGEILTIAQARLRAGDISGLDESVFELEAARKERDLVNTIRDAELLDAKLRTLLGLEQEEKTIKLEPIQIDSEWDINLEQLITSAYAARPDLRAAEIAIEEAGKRLGWERSKIFNFTAIMDFNERGRSGSEFGPGAWFELPIFNRNNGKVSRSKAQLEKAAKQYVAVKQEIALKVREAYINYLSAQNALKILRSGLLSSSITAVEIAEKRYSVGEITYQDYLGFKRQLLDSRLREAESTAELRRASAQLRHSVGFKQKMLKTETVGAVSHTAPF